MQDYKGFKPLTVLSSVVSLVILVWMAIYCAQSGVAISGQALFFMFLFLVVSLIAQGVMLRFFEIGFLVGLFCYLISWRINALSDTNAIPELMIVPFACLVLNFCYVAYQNVKHASSFRLQSSGYEWQLTFVRIYLGFELVPHFTAKLFAGPVWHNGVVQAFLTFQVPHADFFVWLAGLCELGGAIAIGMGLFTRLGAVGIALYLIIAAILGHHFAFGLGWADKGGGWEYAVLWAILMLSFCIKGAGRFSLDQYLNDRCKLPCFVKFLMGGKR